MSKQNIKRGGVWLSGREALGLILSSGKDRNIAYVEIKVVTMVAKRLGRERWSTAL